jgi:hypothetical protein
MFASANFDVNVYKQMRAVHNGWVSIKYFKDYGASFPKEVDFSKE